MPEPVTLRPVPPGLCGMRVGFCGKLPARGDFVASGLPRRFVEPWHDWLQCVLAASRQALGDDWLPAWLAAPVWRFALAPGVCGPDAAVGLWLPSVDRVGRYFPLTLAALAPERPAGALPRELGGFLAAAEGAGRDALAEDLTPEALAARVADAAARPAVGNEDAAAGWPEAGSLWWSDGSERVPAGSFALAALPDATRFAAMLDARERTET